MNFIKYLFLLLSFIFFVACTTEKSESTTESEPTPVQSLEMVWQTDTVFQMPESALYDEQREVIYVSNINLGPREKDGNGYISKLDKEGNLLEQKWITGLSGPKGLAMKDSLLYTADIDELVVININQGQIVEKFAFAQAGMLNDVSISPEGQVYVTDMDSSRVCYLENGAIKIWKDGLNRPNGILAEEGRLVVASMSLGTLTAYDLTSQNAELIADGLTKCDGIIKNQAGNYLVSDWDGEVFLIGSDTTHSVLSTKQDKIQSADLGFIPEENIVLVPTFFGNRVVAYRLR